VDDGVAIEIGSTCGSSGATSPCLAMNSIHPPLESKNAFIALRKIYLEIGGEEQPARVNTS
jgi:hypothetical protein